MPTQRASTIYALLLIAILIYLRQPFHMADTNRVAAAGMPGVGISLTADYAVLSLRKEDGSFENVGRIEGSVEYVKMMQRLSQDEAMHASPPYDTMEELWSDWPRQVFRTARQSIGLAASADVAVLSRMLEKLLNLPASTPGIPARQLPMVISYPAMQGLYQQDIADAAAYLSVHLLHGPQLPYPPRNMVAAYAGHDLGLCKMYRDEEACRQEGLDMPVREVLLVEYTGPTLLLHAGVMREAHDLASRDISVHAEKRVGNVPDSGRDHEPSWVERVVYGFLRAKYGGSGAPEKIIAIMSGDHVREEVAEAVKKAVRGFGSEVEVLNIEPEYVAARGAAELAWRSHDHGDQTEL